MKDSALKHHFIIFLMALIVSATSVRAAAASNINEVFRQLKTSALKKSPDVQMAESTASEKSSNVYTSITHWLPRADLQLSQNTGKDYSIVNSGSLGALSSSFTPTEITQSGWALVASMPIYKRSVHLEIEQTLAEKHIAQNQSQMKTNELDWRLRSLLGNYLLQIYRHAITRNSMEIADSSLIEAKRRFQVGQKTRIDVLRAKANAVSLESKLMTAQTQINEAQNSMLEYSGLTPGEFKKMGVEFLLKDETSIVRVINEFADPNAATKFTSLNESDLHRKIVASSPVYKNYLYEEELSDARSKSIMAQEWPDLAAKASWNKTGADFTAATAENNRSYSYGLVLNIPLFSSGSMFSTYSAQSQAELVSQIQREKSVIELKNEILNEIQNIQAMQKNLESLNINVAQYEEIFRLSQKSYQLGQTTMADLLSSQNDLREAKLNLAQTKVDLSVLTRKLAWNLGENAP